MSEWFTPTRWLILMAVLLAAFGSLHALRETFGARVDRLFWGFVFGIVVMSVGWAFGVELWLAWRTGQ